MLKRDITYINFDGETETETFYFNLSRTELIELELSNKGGMQAYLENIVKSNDNQKIWEEFKKIVLLSYGVRSEDGKRFVKNEQVREEFLQTPAFDALIMEFMNDADAAANFVNGIMPSDFAKNVQNVVPTAFGKTTTPPIPPTQS